MDQNESAPGGLPGYPGTAVLLDPSRRELTPHGTAEFPCAGYTDCYRDSFFPWHWHDEIEIGYIESGGMTVSVNDHRYELGPGSGIFVNSGVLHSYSGKGGGECRFPNVLFHASLIYGNRSSIFLTRYKRPILEAARFSHCILSPEVPWQREAVETIRTAHQLFLSPEEGYECKIRNTLTDLILLLFTHCRERIFSPSAPNTTEIHRIRQMMDFIACRYTQSISLREIAHAALVSERECLRCFRQVIGLSPKQYVLDLRIQRARELLAGSSLSLTEVGEACGFQTQSYFIRLFRRAAGMTPGQYRRASQKPDRASREIASRPEQLPEETPRTPF